MFGRVVRSDQTKASNTIGSVLWLLFDLIFRIALAVSTQGSIKKGTGFETGVSQPNSKRKALSIRADFKTVSTVQQKWFYPYVQSTVGYAWPLSIHNDNQNHIHFLQDEKASK